MSQAKVCVVTGAARGIGLATARRFHREGWSVAMLDVLAEQAAAEAAALGERALALACDVSDEGQVESAFGEVRQRLGRIDVLVANAGIAIFGPMAETSAADWGRVMAVNLTGVFLCGQAAMRHMRERGRGAIVNIASISGLRASTLRIAYGTSKAGVIHLTKQQAVEGGEHGIRANCVCPGPVDTAMALKVHTPAIRQDYHDHMPLNRYGLEEELAAAIFYLASDEASYVTGQVLAVDGGFEATGIGLPTLRREMRQARD